MENIPLSPIFLTDYATPRYLIEEVFICFTLDDEKTLVSSKMQMHRNLDPSDSPLVLQGEQMQLLSIKINGERLDEYQYVLDEKTLTVKNPPASFLLEIENEINPKNNTALEGLYKSGSIFCTQNEPEGFRKITYFLDRPDVMAKYTTKIIADSTFYPVLLSNGNPIGKGQLENGKHWIEWQDPFPKPSYLFALVAGDLGFIEDVFETMSGRTIDLRIYCDKGNESKCHHAMQSLIKAMKWDEEVFGLEYDLDIFMIVAVDAFNMGAMENKGLNIFNTSCVLADPKSATDDNYVRVEAVIAHEYFHNWTGNRVTCRDWFQLTLKEGLTVFRDHEFSADMLSRPLQRVENVLALRQRQFPEDAGPMAHPIQPKSYIQINNFYTATVYEKGSEIIRMIQTMIGKKAFRAGITKYFELYDGKAVTTDDFLHAMQIVSGKDLSQFKRWYNQAGTPKVTFTSDYDPIEKTCTLTIKQRCDPTADHSEKLPFHFPLALGLFGKDGNFLQDFLLEIRKEEESFTFKAVQDKPIFSINQNFSAPIIVESPYGKEELTFLMENDTDPVSRWDAGQMLATDLILSMIEDPIVDLGFIKAFGVILNDPNLDAGLKAKALQLPTEAFIAERQQIINFDGIHASRELVLKALASEYEESFKTLYHQLNTDAPYCYDAKSCGERSLKNIALSYLSILETEEAILLCRNQFKNALNMTDQFASLVCLSNIQCLEKEEALASFYTDWNTDTLVMNKWLAAQASSKLDGTLQKVKLLMADPVFDLKIPNLVRSLIGIFAQNQSQFHQKTGEGYVFLADCILELDLINPQIAAGLASCFKKLANLDEDRKETMKKELKRVIEKPNLSSHVYEIVSKSLDWDFESEIKKSLDTL